MAFSVQVFMVKNYLDKVKADLTIISEATTIPPLISPMIQIGEKGPNWIHLTFFGASGHGSLPKPKSNALEKAVRFMHSIKKMHIPKKKSPLTLKDMFRMFLSRYKLGDLLKILKSNTLEKSPYDEDGNGLFRMFNTSYSFDRLLAGTKVNVIPDNAELEIDFRALPGVSTQMILTAIADYCTALGYRIEFPDLYINPQKTKKSIQTRPVDIQLSIITRADGSIKPLNSEATKFISDTFEAVYQVKAAYIFSPGFTDAGNLREEGIKNIFVMGPSGGNAHAENEYIDLESLPNIVKEYLLIAY